MQSSLYEKIIFYLDKKGVHYTILEHEPIRFSEESSKKTGTNPSQGVKTLLMIGDKKPLMIALSGIDRVDLKKLKEKTGIKDVRMATLDEVKEITGVEVGAVSPFGNLLGLPLYVDANLEKEGEIIFSAGLSTKSILMAYCDFIKIVDPKIDNYAKKNQ